MCKASNSDNFSPSSRRNIIRILGSRCVDIYGSRYADTQCSSYMHRKAANRASGFVSRKEVRKAAGW